MDVTVIGLGLIGGSLCAALRECGLAKRIRGVDTSPLHREQAVELGLVDTTLSLEGALAGADLVVLAIPVNDLIELLPKVLTLADPTTTVTDMGSTKELICRAVEGHPLRRRYVPSHPMSGTENSGPTSFVPGLFARKTAVICEKERCDPFHVERVEGMYRALKMRLVHMGAKEHDLHAAYVSHLSHVISFVLANTVLEKEQDVNTIFDLAGGGFESTVRLAKSSPTMWTPIFEQNRTHVLDALDSYLGHLRAFRDSLTQPSTDENFRLIESANRIRRALESMATRGTKT